MTRSAPTILVTGATGTVGREVAQRIPARYRVRLLTRRPEAVGRTADHIEVVAGEYADPESLDRALHGVDRALLVTADVGGDHDTRFLHAARSAGVRHIVKLSGASVSDPGADDLITRWQRDCERQLCASGMAWTLLRPRSFMSNTLAWAPTISSEGRVRALYGDSVNACVDPRDIADVAVRALTEVGHEGEAHVLTGPNPISAVQQTKLLAELLGQQLTFEELAEDEVRAQYRRRHPGPLADALLRSAERQRAGAKSRVENTVLRVTGHPPRSYAQWAADHLTAFVQAA
ncbi:SDR family oxidoreductase [Streptomyces sp. Da 82-17]|uniref:SDR family oxidoreductase n=1 Tax=Streptomyces sp. Da 82-17 TaxID=3377116 RepID=UPI0038D41117